MQYWLVKSEPGEYSITDLKRDKETLWTGVRNFQARNFMRTMGKGDVCFFYHSNTTEPSIVGLASVSKLAQPDPTQFDPNSPYFEPGVTTTSPRWECVTLRFLEVFSAPVSLTTIKTHDTLATMVIAKKGSRLSVTPVETAHAKVIAGLVNSKKLTF